MLERLRLRARELRKEVFAVYLAARDARTPWYAKAWILLIVAYALSPIDLIPDFVPILGYLDDLLLVPAGLWLAVKLIPAEVLAEARLTAASHGVDRRVGYIGMLVILFIWILAIIWVVSIILHHVEHL